jgi:hypothetical protein
LYVASPEGVFFGLAHLKHQHQLQASVGGKPLGGAHTVIPTAAPTIDRIGKVLENLAVAALNDTTVLQQLTAANLALTASINSLTAANKKLANALVHSLGGTTLAAALAPAKICTANKPFPGNYCYGPMVTGSGQSGPQECNLLLQGYGTHERREDRQHFEW